MRLTASLVLYNNPANQFGDAIRCFLEGSDGRLVVIDNSPVPLAHEFFGHPRVQYAFSGDNLGFGRAHNRALAMIGAESDVHLYLNPDISFGPNVLPTLLDHFRTNDAAGAVMPRIEYMDGSLQRLCKLLPTPIDLFFRRYIPVPALQRAINRRYELHSLPQDRVTTIPFLSGCFLLARTQILQDLKGFDERYFMYMEDVDLVRRIGDRWQTNYVPSVSVSHGYQRASLNNRSLKKIHIRSAISYFQKWGWIWDRERRRRNRQVVAGLRARQDMR